MTSFRLAVFAAALAAATPALADTLTGGFNISGYVDASTVTQDAGVLTFGSGDEVVGSPAGASGSFAGITSGTALDFADVISLYMIYDAESPELFSFVYDGDDYVFNATSYSPGSVVQIAGTFTDLTSSATGFGLVDFSYPSGGIGDFTGSYTSTPSLVVLDDGRGGDDTIPPTSGTAPEPESLALVATALAMGAGLLKRRAVA
ncbi:PEP-CTERM protein-sorting domain-containing protein [Bryocella elongata]|uniref:PEP-CTERM protein-sorting domain-containing protein n=1 Tax=Bryocella elongata TaxID=863522 RepID=A0A1H5XPZ7_9BACT|nr:PEP-CTERM sorting domain-containing protein [Bryocella elongata]SEG13831.1 PEP-CTERM protein-sorting domain-containing protein [Bryocella elongata]